MRTRASNRQPGRFRRRVASITPWAWPPVVVAGAAIGDSLASTWGTVVGLATAGALVGILTWKALPTENDKSR